MSVGGSPSASAIVVCWNSADVIGRCLEHLLAQDYEDYEIVVVDDGSRDETVEIAERYLGSGKLTIVRSPMNRGCPHARNLGLKHARGEIVAFIDGDGFAAPSWLRHIVETFAADATIGGVASTVFMASNPLVLNGTGGILNRQGWAADISMNIPYQRAPLVTETLYPMGCGMALRRSAIERVGPFDDYMLNYYDDVDYGVRLWRAGYRVVVARDAWIDHGFGHSSGEDSPQKQLLCEQHRIRVVLKHASLGTIARWLPYEIVAALRAGWPRRELKRQAFRWNVRNLPSTLRSRWRLRKAPRAPERLMDPSWGEGFPSGVPKLIRPEPAAAVHEVDMADPEVEERLPYGWFTGERIHGRPYRWSGRESSALVSLERPATKLRLEYAHVPRDIGGIDLSIHRLGGADPLLSAWATRLPWQFIERSVENHPIALPAGDYEVRFSADGTWSDPPAETRELAFALARMAFEDAVPPAVGLEMGSRSAEEQLVGGWFEPEQLGERTFRWAGTSASALVRVEGYARSLSLTYCMPPASVGGVELSVRKLHRVRSAWSTWIPWQDGDWHEQRFALRLAPGDYVVSFKPQSTWSNPDGLDRTLGPENRSLGIAVASVGFTGDDPGSEAS